MTRGRAFTRKMAFRKAVRKRNIDRDITPGAEEHPRYNNLHQYSKNKIHCSCALCREKSKEKCKHSDAVKIESLESNLVENDSEENENV